MIFMICYMSKEKIEDVWRLFKLGVKHLKLKYIETTEVAEINIALLKPMNFLLLHRFP